MTRTILTIILITFLTITAHSRNLKIRIFTSTTTDSVFIKPVTGTYKVFNLKTKKHIEININSGFYLKVSASAIRLSTPGSPLPASFDSISIKGSGLAAAFRIRNLNSPSKDRIYNDNLTIKIRNGHLFLINHIDIERYLPAVVEAEGSLKNTPPEFFKVQAIICRTYAIRNARRHTAEGFNLCDQEHCQVYKGRCRNSSVAIAVTSTAGDVIVDSDGKFINAAFHANCGGRTANSEDVWTHPATYLKAVDDTFCLSMTKARWEKTITKKDFTDWLSRCNIRDTTIIDSLIRFRQNNRKALFFDTIKLKQLRDIFALRSTFFSISPLGDSLLFSGRGNGHGIGLCQEGAMNMISHGLNYKQVISHYYTKVKIINYNKYQKK